MKCNELILTNDAKTLLKFRLLFTIHYYHFCEIYAIRKTHIIGI